MSKPIYKIFRVLLLALVAFTAGICHAVQFDVAHVREQGQDMIVFPLNSQIQYRSDQERGQMMYALQRCASSARLGGTVVMMWEANGRTMFMAPRQWHGFFSSVDMLWVAKNVNKKLTCNF
jgi:hypothetical protein